MSLAFANRRTWVFDEQLEMILQDDGYKRVSAISDVEIGDLIVYREGKQFRHVGIVAAVRRAILTSDTDKITVLSKWGQNGEYVHDANAVPLLFGTTTEYWTESRKV